MLVETMSGRFVNLARARSAIVRKQSDPEKTILFVDWGDDQREYEVYETFDLEVETAPIIPANPGFTVLIYLAPDDQEQTGDIVREPVIAFRPIGEISYPVTPDVDYATPLHASNEWALKLPDGHVLIPGTQLFENEAECLRAWDEAFIKKRAKGSSA